MVTRRESGAVGRAMRVARLGAGLAGSYLGYQMQRLLLDKPAAARARQAMRRRQGTRLRRELSSLRGPVMKLGQILSMQTQSFPPEIIEELATLQMQAPPMHPSLMRAQFRNALGKYPEEIFKSFEPEPFAAASLGQAHRAVTRQGEPVCVKIQYPAIREAIENDFKALRAVSLPARLSRHLPVAMIEEAEQQMLEETDYRKEAANLDYFVQGLKPVPFVRVPKVFKELSAEKVLTMSFLEGLHLEACLAEHPSHEWRDAVGARLVEVFYHQVFEMRALHADPHPGNYLFNPDGTFGLIDFGCVKRLDPRMLVEIRHVLRRDWAGDPRRTADLVRGLSTNRVSAEAPAVLRAMRMLGETYDLLYPRGAASETKVDFSDKGLLRRLEHLVRNLIANRFACPEFLFFSRAEIGLYNTLHRLGARVATGRLVLDILGRKEKAQA